MAKGKRKVHSLTGRITPELMFEAWRAVGRNRGAAGVDKVSGFSRHSSVYRGAVSHHRFWPTSL